MLWLLFSFKGRVGRLSYFGVAALCAVAYIANTVLVLKLDLQGAQAQALKLPPAEALNYSLLLMQQHLMAVAISFVLLWIVCANATKRLHDINKSGWWTLYLCSSPFVILGLVVAGVLHMRSGGAMLYFVPAGALGLLSAWLRLQLLFRGGDAGVNDYGAPGAPGGDGWDEARGASGVETAMAATIAARRNAGVSASLGADAGARAQYPRLAPAGPRTSFGRR